VSRIAEIDQEIEQLKEKLPVIKGRETEVYSRIVGYYRSVNNWNPGKRSEYKERLTFEKLKL
jgi:anaerobic ribonucleoside-triphosphate reductase